MDNLLNQKQDKSCIQFDEDLTNIKSIFENNNKNMVYILNKFLNSCAEMNLDEIVNYVTELNKNHNEELINLPNFKENQNKLILILELIKKKVSNNEFDKLLDNFLQEKELDDEIKDELNELDKDKELNKTLENNFGEFSNINKLFGLVKDLTSDNQIDFNKLTDKDYFNNIVKNIEEKEDNLCNSEEICKIVENNPVLKNIYDQLINRIENNENIDFDFVKDISEKIAKNL